jgi:ribosomal protein S9
MKPLFILMALVCITGCNTIEIREDGSVICEGIRKCSVATPKVVVVSGEVLLNQDSVQILGKETAQIVKDK